MHAYLAEISGSFDAQGIGLTLQVQAAGYRPAFDLWGKEQREGSRNYRGLGRGNEITWRIESACRKE